MRVFRAVEYGIDSGIDLRTVLSNELALGEATTSPPVVQPLVVVNPHRSLGVVQSHAITLSDWSFTVDEKVQCS